MKRIESATYLLFDGDCGICTYLAGIARTMDRKGRFIIEPYQAFSELELGRFGITYEKCTKRLYVISRSGRVYPGAFGTNYFLFYKFPWSVIVFLIYLIPPLLLVEIIGYRVVAMNRHRISRWFGLKACALKPIRGPRTEETMHSTPQVDVSVKAPLG
jgi:predicted DCC family thiol-disulfide oxidoreductase YuxK